MKQDFSELIRFCRVTLGGKDDGDFPIQQIDFMENTSDCFMVFPYGMSANVASDSIGALFSVNGDDQSLAALMTSAKERVKNLEQNEVVFFHPKTKSFTHYRNSGDVDISVNGSENVTIAQDWTVSVGGDVNISVGGSTNISVGGSTTVDSTGDINVTTEGDANIGVLGDVNLTAAAVNVTTPVATFSGNVTCASLTVGAGGATVSGSITATGDVTGAGKSLENHTHIGSPTAPTGIISNTGAPV